MRTKKCPLCKSTVDDEAEHCPNCPHSFLGEEHGVQRRRHGHRSAKPYVLVAFVAAAAYAGWQALSFIMSYADKETNGPRAVASGRSAGTLVEAVEEMKAVEAGETAGGRLRPRLVNRAYTTLPRDEDAPASSRTTNAPSRWAEEPVPRYWRLRGMVYDLVTLKPLPRATMVFKDSQSNRRFETMTDDQGRYRVEIPSLHRSGYSVTILRPGYALSYLAGGRAGVERKPEAARRRLARELGRALDGPATVAASSADPVKTDFFLAPIERTP